MCSPLAADTGKEGRRKWESKRKRERGREVAGGERGRRKGEEKRERERQRERVRERKGEMEKGERKEWRKYKETDFEILSINKTQVDRT